MAPIGGHHSPAGSEDWLTPPAIIDGLGPFELDPCCPPRMPWRTARRMYHLGESDGLSLPWKGRVWLNPPYGAQTGAWLRRLALHGDGFALVFARTETEAWHRWVWQRASAILFLAGRLNFYRPDGERSAANAGGPSAIVAYGEECAAKLVCVDTHGIGGGLVLQPAYLPGRMGTEFDGDYSQGQIPLEVRGGE